MAQAFPQPGEARALGNALGLIRVLETAQVVSLFELPDKPTHRALEETVDLWELFLVHAASVVHPSNRALIC